MNYCKTLRELATLLGVSYYRIRKIRDQIADEHPLVPAYMVWGTKGYPISTFAKRITS